MANQDNLDLGPETQDFDDSEFTMDLGSEGDEDDEWFLEDWDVLDTDLFFDPYTGDGERDEWDYGPDYYLDEFDY